MGAVVIEGAKGCGKTETARQQARSEVQFDLDDVARETAEVAPKNILEGATPRLLDEWQLVRPIWNAVRRTVDERGRDGQFILTGSATPADDITRHTGAGRFSRFRMRTLTLSESGMSSNQVSLESLLSKQSGIEGRSPMSLDDMIDETCHGGWPVDRQRPTRAARRNVADYIAETVNVGVKGVDGVRRDPNRVLALMRALARNTSTEATITTLTHDVGETALEANPSTVSGYLQALERLTVVEPLTSWSPVLRSKARLRRSVKHHFVDPAISASLLNSGVDELRRDIKTFGFLFESLAIRDLRVYAEANDAAVHHYRDSNGLEVDAIVDAGFGRWGACEIRISGGKDVIDRAARTLVTFAKTVDSQSSGDPQFLAVITAQGDAYMRPDAVAVIPLATLTR
ncbi:MAG: DUF4143 domain-containing protein [Propionibacteriaceae bacterium]|nr:DUF4143 domain-containing protein [Propionibacteriaceae bacterium]